MQLPGEAWFVVQVLPTQDDVVQVRMKAPFPEGDGDGVQCDQVGAGEPDGDEELEPQ